MTITREKIIEIFEKWMDDKFGTSFEKILDMEITEMQKNNEIKKEDFPFLIECKSCGEKNGKHNINCEYVVG